GQYCIGVETVPQADAASSKPPPRWFERFGILLPFVLAILLAGNLWFMARGVSPTEAPANDPITSYPVWSALMDDEIPILLVLGDFYIFGELNASGNIQRMIREFDINSRQDLEDRMNILDENYEQSINLDLNYLPEGTGYALARIAPIL